MRGPSVVECRSIQKTYPTAEGGFLAVDGFDLTVGEGEFLCLVGPSGCGKTTILKMLAGLLDPTAGEIQFADGAAHRSLVFQEDALFPWMTVAENVAIGLSQSEEDGQGRAAATARFVDTVGLARFANRYPHELSGGMRQRVNLARALVSAPRLLLMDEPFRSLDAQTRLLLQEELLRLWQRTRQEVLFVTHDIEEAILLGDRVVVMSGNPGRIVADLPIDLQRPRDLTGRAHPDLAEMKWTIWKLLKEDARERLSAHA